MPHDPGVKETRGGGLCADVRLAVSPTNETIATAAKVRFIRVSMLAATPAPVKCERPFGGPVLANATLD
jgi:hypothetical protein